MFGPVMVVWFAAIGVCGIGGIVGNRGILKALTPTYGVCFLVSHFSTAFFALAAVVLAITGAEALYADMGHFGRVPITRAWLLLVFPACLLSYLGQAALILDDPRNIASPLFPRAGMGRLPMIVVATAATVIASQAVISGAFSVSRQAVQLGYLPRKRINHTSAQTDRADLRSLGELDADDLRRRSGAHLAVVDGAGLRVRGMAVTGTITITTLLYLYVVRQQWHRPLWSVVGAAGAFLFVDGLFLAANLTKITRGHGCRWPSD